MTRPNILFLMTDQQRADTIAALGNPIVHTPNLDRLVRRGVAFTNAHSTCPVCVPARYTIRTGREPLRTGCYENMQPGAPPGQPEGVEARCGEYLGRAMARRGYRTFGIGKFHTVPHNEKIGYETDLRTHEIHGSERMRAADPYAAFLAREHPAYDFVEQLMGERTEMYYMPQMSPLPAELGHEAWCADRAIEEISRDDGRPFFGFVSCFGPHPPFAPPVPFNRMYDPDRMPGPVRGDAELDRMDEQVNWMNYGIWADEISPARARALKARYYGEISYIDQQLGRMLEAIEARGDAENTLVALFSDHGDMLGDHGAWQKECFFEAACRVPLLVSWPARLAADARREDLVCLTDLFGLATAAADEPDARDGIDLVGLLENRTPGREALLGWYGTPGTRLFKVMVRAGEWKYVFMANGGREQLFNLDEDPAETVQRLEDMPDAAARLRALAVGALRAAGEARALDGNALRAFPFEARLLKRIIQFDTCRAPARIPDDPAEVLRLWQRKP